MSTTELAGPRPRSRAAPGATFAVLMVSAATFSLLQSLVIPVLPTIQAELGTTQTGVTWVVTAYLLSTAVCTPIAGRLGDATGKKRVMLASLLLLVAGCCLAAVAESLAVMLVARVIQGAGGGVLPLAFGIIRDELPAEKVPGAVGTISALVAVGSGTGLVLAGPIVTFLGYPWLFWVLAIAFGAAALATLAVVSESPSTTAERLDWTAATLFALWLAGLLLIISQGQAWGWAAPQQIALIVATPVVIALWARVELRSASPLIDLRMMRRPAVLAANTTALLLGVGMMAAFAFIPQFLQTPTDRGYGFGASTIESGLMLLPMAVGMFVLALFAGPLTNRFGAKALAVAGCLLTAAGYLTVALAHTAPLQIYVATALVGVGLGLSFSAVTNLVIAAVPRSQTGVASGVNANLRTVGSCLGAALMAAIVTGADPGNALPTEAGYTTGFVVISVIVVVAAVVACASPRTTTDARSR